MSIVQNREMQNMVFSVLSVFVLDFFYKFDVCMIGKNCWIFLFVTQTSQIDWFAASINSAMNRV